MAQTERDIEAHLVREVRARNGLCFKWVSPGRVGVPDRILILPHGVTVFVELKVEGGELSAVQKLTLREIANLGHAVYVIYGDGGVGQLMTIVDGLLRHARASIQ